MLRPRESNARDNPSAQTTAWASGIMSTGCLFNPKRFTITAFLDILECRSVNECTVRFEARPSLTGNGMPIYSPRRRANTVLVFRPFALA
jgi:hypothetical protein